jgi:hypothetical protein
MIDLAVEQAYPLHEALKFVPPSRGAKRTHLSTLLRWILTGVKGPEGELIRLEAVRLGGRWVTTREALQRFAERLTPNLQLKPASRPRAAVTQQRASGRAAKRLQKMGY